MDDDPSEVDASRILIPLLNIEKQLERIEAELERRRNEYSLILFGVDRLEKDDDLIWEIRKVFTLAHIEIPDSCIVSAVWEPAEKFSIIVKFTGDRWKKRVLDSREKLEVLKYSVQDYPPSGARASYFRIIFWNCASYRNINVLESKLNLPTDILCLCETKSPRPEEAKEPWTLFNYRDKCFTEYTEANDPKETETVLTPNKPMTSKPRGSPSGGMMMAVPKKLFSGDFDKSQNNTIFFYENCKTNTRLIIGNIYLCCNTQFNASLEELRSTLGTIVKEYKDIPIVIGGDFNCWVGEIDETSSVPNLNNWRVHNRRWFLGQKTSPNGEKFLKVLDEYNMVILNGRCQSDRPGKVTRKRKEQETTVDYVAITRQHVEHVEDFEVLNDTEKSDHYPIVVTINHSILDI